MSRINLMMPGAGLAGLASTLAARSKYLEVATCREHPDVGGRLRGDLQGPENGSSDTDMPGGLEHYGIRP